MSPVLYFIRQAIDFALPLRCPSCGIVVGEEHGLCITCWQGLTFLTDSGCTACGAPVDAADQMCGRCLQAPPVHGVVTSGVTYGQVAKTIALKLKHGRRVGLAETIGHLLAPRVAAAPPSILIPVPLHRWRLWSRGFNQSVLIAQAVARRSQHRVEQHLLKRAKATPLLRGLGAKDRAKAVQGAFAVDKKARDLLKGQRVILVDDVYTSGATANACAKALKRAGASEVLVLCWARVLAGDQDAY